MKNSLLFIVYLLLTFIVTFISLFILRSFVFVVLHYNPIEGIQPSLVSIHILTLIRDIFPFVVLISIVALFVRFYRKPGIVWLSYFFIIVISAGIWFFGFTALSTPQRIPVPDNPTRVLFPDSIHDFEDARVYIHNKDENRLYAPMIANTALTKDQSRLIYPETIPENELRNNRYFTFSPSNPTFSPLISISPLFSTILEEFRLFKEELYRLFKEDKTVFYLMSITVLFFFVFSSIVLRITQFPLFLVIAVLVTVRLFFFLFHSFFSGVPATVLSLFTPKTIYLPILGIGFFSVIFFLTALRYSLVHPASKRKQLE